MKNHRDYQGFLNEDHSRPPQIVTERVMALVRADLNPNSYLIFAKLLLIHTVSAVATLSVCPQFGIRILGEGMGLMHAFMALGTFGCFVACGAFFMGTSLLVATFAMKPEEIRAVRKSRWLMTGALAILSLGVFIMIGPEFVFSLTMPWLFGSLFGSVATLELGWRLRFRTI